MGEKCNLSGDWEGGGIAYKSFVGKTQRIRM
jgi:hypothetical protein